MTARLRRFRLGPLWIGWWVLAVAAVPCAAESPGGALTDALRIVNTYPHDPTAYTQGLIYHQGYFYESTGLRGKSTLRKVVPETGQVVQIRPLPSQYFGEGLARWGDRLIQLTWQSRLGFIYDLKTFKLTGTFQYATEGWGLTEDGTSLIMSDGSATLYLLDPETYREKGRLRVQDGGISVDRLNELEAVRGEILANLYGKDIVLRISPKNGRVLGSLDLSRLRSSLGPVRGAEVLNGIAYDPKKNRLFVTGKLWPKVFEIEIPGLTH